MTAPSGRSIYVTTLAPVIAKLGVDGIVARARHAHLSALWVRMARGERRDANLDLPKFAALRDALRQAGIGLWGWHVPFCPDGPRARAEADSVARWAADYHLDGVIADAERTPESPRFTGTAADAAIYAEHLAASLGTRGIAFSSHDQPQLHGDLPFAQFLKYIPTACPQVYATSSDPSGRFGRSETGYRPLLGPAFKARFQPTGNICIEGDVAFRDVATCLTAVTRFLQLVAAAGYDGHSFWCWEEAPEQVWDVLHAH